MLFTNCKYPFLFQAALLGHASVGRAMRSHGKRKVVIMYNIYFGITFLLSGTTACHDFFRTIASSNR